MRYHLTARSGNEKTGPIPVSTTSRDSCPPSCPLSRSGCYAESGKLNMHWDKVDSGERGGTWREYTIAISALPEGQLWRHNQAGDLPGVGDKIDSAKLLELSRVSAGTRGFTYTHKPPTGSNLDAIRRANSSGGLTVNLSANNLAHADELADLDAGPVVVLLPSEIEGNVRVETPRGRRVVVCPATYRDDVTCESCQLCAWRDREVIIGFPAHGTRKAKASAVAKGDDHAMIVERTTP